MPPGPRPDGGEVPAVEGSDFVDAEALGQHDHRRVRRPQRKIVVPLNQLGDSHIIDVEDVSPREIALPERSDERALRPDAATAVQQVGGLGHHRVRFEHPPTREPEPGEEVHARPGCRCVAIAAATSGPVSTRIRGSRDRIRT